MKNYQLLHKLHKATDRSLHFIHHHQLENGSFLSSTGSVPIFYASLIGSLLLKNTDSISLSIKKKVATLLVREKSEQWSFNYWQKHSAERIAIPYPDDLDDTFVALHALHNCNKELIDEKAWVAIVNTLTANEVAEGGPYYTWIVPPDQRGTGWNDIDIVVNSNIVAFLSQYEISLPKVQDFFEEIISSKSLSSHYYHDEILISYFLSKAYTGNNKHILRDTIVKQKNKQGYWESPLKTACSITALLNLGENPKNLVRAIEYLLKIECNGSWDMGYLFIERKGDRENVYSGCEAFVSACCVEAFTTYAETISRPPQTVVPDEEIFIQHTMALARKRFIGTSLLMQKQFDQALNALATKDPRYEIVLLPFHFAKNMSREISADIISNLALANLHGWIGYSIKDAVMDDHSSAELLPCATICIRESIELFNTSIQHPMLNPVLDAIENSLSWESANCRLQKIGNRVLLPDRIPDYGSFRMLADKSFGHALGPILMTYHGGNKKQLTRVKRFFTHYLIARQLNDDAHDWLQDLANGFMNSVSTDILKDWRTHGTKNYIVPELEGELLEQLFWERHIDGVTSKINRHCKKARKAIKKINILKDTDFLERLIQPLELSAKKAIKERDKAKDFLTQLR